MRNMFPQQYIASIPRLSADQERALQGALSNLHVMGHGSNAHLALAARQEPRWESGRVSTPASEAFGRIRRETIGGDGGCITDGRGHVLPDAGWEALAKAVPDLSEQVQAAWSAYDAAKLKTIGNKLLSSCQSIAGKHLIAMAGETGSGLPSL